MEGRWANQASLSALHIRSGFGDACDTFEIEVVPVKSSDGLMGELAADTGWTELYASSALVSTALICPRN